MTDVWNGVADEFLHLYPSGTRLLAVAGQDAERSRHAADAVATALTGAGQQVERAHADGDEAALRADVIAPFRQAPRTDRVLVVSGPAALLSESARGMWNFTLWQLVGNEAPHSVASALVDVTDPENPVRRFADYCALPASFGA
ncbi:MULTISPECIES: hypothetical protein [unclassified Microbacterium]|uniref:hypothetical protein n=1 Tax=unclassified Microbacterium TaxID=2609290 RepID=UPI000EA9689E|nr:MULTISPECIES: hypothetical protein [unclassified Microbacterium]MBT2483297.1 hypothetical protein [Microbacterium sp. ISL-108]RKN66335.1 hypothetical protein D7252_01145 [Microbacterium sp. CGR2]